MTTPLTPTTTAGPSDFARLKRGRRMPIQFHADLAAEIYSGLALGLFAYMAMLRDGEEFSIRQMQRTHKEGRDAWSGALAELLELGLVARVRWADGRGQWRTRYYLAQDHAFDAEDIAYLREVHGMGCLIECSPGLGNVPIQVSSRVSKRPRKGVTSPPGESGSVDNSTAIRRDRATPLVAPAAAIATIGQPADAIAATGTISDDADPQQAGGVAAIAGALEEGKDLLLPPPYPPHANTSPEQEPTSTGGRGDDVEHPHTGQVMGSVLRTWPILSRRDRATVQQLVNQRLAQGHGPDGLRQLLCGNTDGVRMPGRLLIARLDGLGEPVAEPAGRLPWCGACDDRWIDHGLGLHRCPACHPAGDSSADCPDCLEVIARHATTHRTTAWCGHCDSATRTVRNQPCPTCHPERTALSTGPHELLTAPDRPHGRVP